MRRVLMPTLAHKHLPERAPTPVDRSTDLSADCRPFYKGLALTAYLHPKQFSRKATPADVQKVLADYYASEPSIAGCSRWTSRPPPRRVFPANVEANNGTNRVDIAVFGNSDRMLLIARLDNLGKGASGAAVQSMNVHLGVEESLGLV